MICSFFFHFQEEKVKFDEDIDSYDEDLTFQNMNLSRPILKVCSNIFENKKLQESFFLFFFFFCIFPPKNVSIVIVIFMCDNLKLMLNYWPMQSGSISLCMYVFCLLLFGSLCFQVIYKQVSKSSQLDLLLKINFTERKGFLDLANNFLAPCKLCTELISLYCSTGMDHLLCYCLNVLVNTYWQVLIRS